MGELLQEFDELIKLAELEEEKNRTTYLEDSERLIDKARNFLEDDAKTTWYGVEKSKIKELITFDETEIMPWKHVTLTMDVSKLKTINDERLITFAIPSFVEEVMGIGDANNSGFGFNEYGRNNIVKLFIPYSVIVIDSYAFAFYKNLEKVSFDVNSKLLNIGDYAFACCDKLSKLDMGNCDYITEFSSNIINNSGVTELILSKGIEEIDNAIFEYEQIKKLSIKDSCSCNLSTFKYLYNTMGAFWLDSNNIENYNF